QGGRACRPVGGAAPGDGLPAPSGAGHDFGREALGIGAASILGLRSDGGRQRHALRSPDVLSPFRLLFDQLRAVGRCTGPSSVLPTVVAQTQIGRATGRESHTAGWWACPLPRTRMRE